ncbi:RsiV family protein [Eubacterium ventriosum]|jgi:hypothetical protein|uniref:RsiV family protein n=1 Tax=Eubacterium ventriosum TaxID=39496 RepID=UPI00267275A7|nr:RsiV family protein [Eubacterium ventriosum]
MKKIINSIFTSFLIVLLTIGTIFALPNNNVFAAKKTIIKSYSKKYSVSKKHKTIAIGAFYGLSASGNSKLAKSINSLNSKTKKSFLNEWKSLKEYATEPDSYGDRMFVYYKISKIGECKNFISLETTYSEHSGGAHPTSTCSYSNIYKKTGKKVYLKTLAKCSIKSFNKKVIKIINKTIADKATAVNSSKIIKKYKFKDYNFYYKDNQLHIFFNPYDIGPYALGPIDIIVK